MFEAASSLPNMSIKQLTIEEQQELALKFQQVSTKFVLAFNKLFQTQAMNHFKSESTGLPQRVLYPFVLPDKTNSGLVHLGSSTKKLELVQNDFIKQQSAIVQASNVSPYQYLDDKFPLIYSFDAQFTDGNYALPQRLKKRGRKPKENNQIEGINKLIAKSPAKVKYNKKKNNTENKLPDCK